MSKRDDNRALTYFRQSVIQRWLGENHRGRICVRHRLPDAQFVGAIKKNDRASYVNLMVCKNLWTCPFCANIASLKRRNAIQRAIAEFERRGVALAFATYTIRHSLSDTLASEIRAVLDSHAGMHSGKAWQTLERRHGWVGSIKTCETTYGGNGWHFHLHELGFVANGFNRAALEGDLFARWHEQLSKNGFNADSEHGLKIKQANDAVRDYVSKWGIVPELASGADKKARRGGILPFQLPDFALAHSEKRSWAQGRFEDYALHTKGVKQIWASPSVRPFLREQENDDKGTTFDESALVRLTDDDWHAIKRRGVRAIFLSYFERDLVDEFLELLHNGEVVPKLEDL